ncbi:MAG: phosphatase PAP2 family protein [Deltaproteobacteria bacterium]|nr:phosphatase PAP2 family protein [Deltaproteobacteria bacterium]MBI2500927.1 phosphatase PAP2 family protein [Deltaproteobacteria bacterium]MBI4197374.1 phosphatase PAP2 family protein [Deltaproteobacteria bacterium]
MIERLQKHLLFIGVTALYVPGYMGVNWISSRRSDLHQMVLPFEREIPFIPEFIWAYLLIYVFVTLPYLLVDDLVFFRKVVKAFLICIVVHFAFFLIYPVEYVLRPAVDYEWGGIYKLITFYYWVDLPYNCFPSMHISNAFMVAYMLREYRPVLGKILFPGAVLVAISVVLVKQHYIADVVSGYVVGWGIYWLVFKAARFTNERGRLRS